MLFFRILNADPADGMAIMLCLITIWWCVRYVPRGSGPARFVLAILGVLSACLGARILDAVISAALLLAAIMLEVRENYVAPSASRRAGLRNRFELFQ